MKISDIDQLLKEIYGDRAAHARLAMRPELDPWLSNVLKCPSALSSLLSKLKKARETLSFYAGENSYCNECVCSPESGFHLENCVLNDDGEKARQTLKELEDED